MIKKIFKANFIFYLLLIFLAGACNRHLTKFNPETVKLYPPPPDTARLQFLTSFSNSQQINGPRSAFSRFLFGEPPVKELLKPYGITIKGAKIYICDTGLRGIVIIDLENKDYQNFIPSGKGQLNVPLNCCLDEFGNLFVADGDRKQVVVFDKSLNYAYAIGEAEEFKPTDVFVSGNNIYISNITGHQISVYDKITHSKKIAFPESETGKEEFLYSPTNIFVNDSGIYVSDMGDSKVKRFSLDGRYISSFGSYGKNPGQFVRLKGIALDRESNVYAVDAGFENVQIFNEKGQLLMFFGGPYKGPGDMWLPAKVAIDYENLGYFRDFVDPEYSLEYLVFVTNQYGPEKISIYGFIKPLPEVIK